MRKWFTFIMCMLIIVTSVMETCAETISTTPKGAIVHTITDGVEGKAKPKNKSKTVMDINMSDEIHVLSCEGDWVNCYVDTGTECIRVWLKSSDITYSNKVGSPVDLSDGKWYMLTYEGHGAASGESYQEYAVDINLPGSSDEGKPVYAIADGTVTLVIPSNGSVRICHHDAVKLRSGSVIAENTFYSWMGHMKNITVSKGDEVKKGDIIGYISNKTDQYSDLSPHLHFVVGASTDPYGKPVIPISPYWLAESPLADSALYCDNENGDREPEGLYENGILNDSVMP